MMALTKKQKGVLKGLISGLIISLFFVFFALFFNPFGFSKGLGMMAQFSLMMKLLIVLALCLGVSVGRLAKHRFFTPEDIDGMGLTVGSSKAKILQAQLQNTLEQVGLAVLVYFSWVAMMPSEWLSVIPVAVGLFFIGRLLFYFGYQTGAASRSLGFTLTFYPTMIMLFICLFVCLFMFLF